MNQHVDRYHMVPETEECQHAECNRSPSKIVRWGPVDADVVYCAEHGETVPAAFPHVVDDVEDYG